MIAEQLRLEGTTEVPFGRLRLHPATVLVGKRGIAECRAILAAVNLGTEVHKDS